MDEVIVTANRLLAGQVRSRVIVNVEYIARDWTIKIFENWQFQAYQIEPIRGED
jgi:hypothetical protein